MRLCYKLNIQLCSKNLYDAEKISTVYVHYISLSTAEERQYIRLTCFKLQ